MDYTKKTITRAGAELLANGNAHGKGTKIDKIIITNSDKTINEQKDLTTITLDDFEDYKELTIKRMRNTENTFQPEAVFSNKNLAQDYPINMIGLLAFNEDAEDQKVLLAVSVASEPFKMQHSTDTPFNLIISMAISYSYSENITANIIEPGSITDEDLEDYVKKDELDELKKEINISINSDDSPIKKDIEQLKSNKVTDNKDDSIEVNGKKLVPSDKSYVDSVKEFAKFPEQPLKDGDDVFKLPYGILYNSFGKKLVNPPDDFPDRAGKTWATFISTIHYLVGISGYGTIRIADTSKKTWKKIADNKDLDNLKNDLQNKIDYSYIRTLTDDDDIYNLPLGTYRNQFNKNPKNNPWGSNNYAQYAVDVVGFYSWDNKGNIYTQGNREDKWHKVIREPDLNNALSAKASKEEAQYNVIKRLNDNDDIFTLGKGHYSTFGTSPKNAPYSNIYSDIYVSEFNIVIRDNIYNTFVIPDNHVGGWKKYELSVDVDNKLSFKADKSELKNYAKQSDLDEVEENVNKNINDDNSPINQKISSLQSDKASNDDLNQTKNNLQKNIDTKASKEEAQYNIIRVLNNQDDIFNLPKGHFVINGSSPINAPFKNMFADVYVNEHSIDIRDNIYQTFNIPDDRSNGWKKYELSVDVDTKMAQQKAYFEELAIMKPSNNPEYDSRVNPLYKFYKP